MAGQVANTTACKVSFANQCRTFRPSSTRRRMASSYHLTGAAAREQIHGEPRFNGNNPNSGPPRFMSGGPVAAFSNRTRYRSDAPFARQRDKR
jgi:hypothetical protein